jgi:hypothetical protein
VRQASSPERTEEIQVRLRGPNCKAEMVVERWTGSGWAVVDDVDGAAGIDIKKSFKKQKYATFGLTPDASTCEFTVLNKDGRYSEGSGEDEEGAFGLDTKIRVRAGYILPTAALEPLTLVFPKGECAENRFFRAAPTILGNPRLVPGLAGEPEIMLDLFASRFGAARYGSARLCAAGYCASRVDAGARGVAVPYEVRVSATTAGHRVFARTAQGLAEAERGGGSSSEWTEIGQTVAGTAALPYAPAPCRFVEVAVLFEPPDLEGAMPEITAMELGYRSRAEWLYWDVFYCDTPEFTDPKLAMPTVSVKARDSWKRALEADVSIPDLSAGVALDDLVRMVADRCGLPYTSGSIADLSAFADRALAGGYEKPVKAADVLEDVMQVLNGEGTSYNMYLEYDAGADDNVLFVQPAPERYIADFVFNYRHYDSIGARRKNYDRLLKRLSLTGSQEFPKAEQQLAQATYSTEGNKTLSWSGKAAFKRYSVELLSGTEPAVSLSDCRPEEMTFSIAGNLPFSLRITVHGDRWNADPAVQGEWIDHGNQIAGRGTTSSAANPLLLDDDEARRTCKGMVEKFGTPVNETNALRFPYLHLLLELNDAVLVWARFVFVDTIHYLTGVSYHWDRAEAPADGTSFNLDDSGLRFSDISDFEYDAVEDYDIGYVYDMQFGPQATDEEIDAGSPIVHNQAAA